MTGRGSGVVRILFYVYIYSIIYRIMPYNDPDPEKDIARQRLNKAVRKGEIIRPDHCSNCLVPCVPHGHHENYDEEYKVVWLCTACHSSVHYPNGPKRPRLSQKKMRDLITLDVTELF